MKKFKISKNLIKPYVFLMIYDFKKQKTLKCYTKISRCIRFAICSIRSGTQ